MLLSPRAASLARGADRDWTRVLGLPLGSDDCAKSPTRRLPIASPLSFLPGTLTFLEDGLFKSLLDALLLCDCSLSLLPQGARSAQGEAARTGGVDENRVR